MKISYCQPVTGSLRLMSAGVGPAGRAGFGELVERQRRVGGGRVRLRTCYLALSRAQHRPGGYSWVVVVAEPGRALRSGDVAAAVGTDHVVTIPSDSRIGCAVDAGTILSALPEPLRKFDQPGGPARRAGPDSDPVSCVSS